MTDSNLVRWLTHQTKRAVHLVELDTVRRGAASLRAELDKITRAGGGYAVVDAISDSDLDVLAEASSRDRFTSGASGITAALGRRLAGSNAVPLDFDDRLRQLGPGILVVSGSLSPTTHAQTEQAIEHGFCAIRVNALEILGGLTPEMLAERARPELERGRPTIIASHAASPQHVRAVQIEGKRQGLSREQTGERIVRCLAEAAKLLVEQCRVSRLVASGGETSGIICQVLELTMLEAGLPLAPGVPFCFPLSRPDLLVVLKSGNFGGEQLYATVETLGRHPSH